MTTSQCYVTTAGTETRRVAAQNSLYTMITSIADHAPGELRSIRFLVKDR
jgi:hypothetical protein